MQIAGLLLIILGIAAVINEFIPFGLWNFIGSYWPLAFVAGGLYRLLARKKNDAVSWALIVVFGLIQIAKLNMFRGSIGKLLLGVFIAYLGYQLLTGNNGASVSDNNKPKNDRTFTEDEPTRNRRAEKHDDSKIVILNTDLLDESYSFKTAEYKVLSNTFSGGKIGMNFSHIVLDLRDCVPLNFITELDLVMKASDLEIRIPDDWEANFDDGKTAKESSGQPNYILNIKYQAAMSSVKVV